jgi:acyl-CoA dehydrogenase
MLPIYALTAEQIEIQSLARDFAGKEILPSIQLYEKESLDESNLLDKICQSGLVNTRIPEEFGGLGLSLLETCLITEEFAFACSGISSIAEASELAITILLAAGSQEQKSKYLTILTKENGLAGIALFNSSEISQGGFSAKQNEKSIVLNGYCPLVLNAAFAQWLLVPCPSDSSVKLSHFIVPRKTKGLKILSPLVPLGRKAASACPVYFDNVELEPIARIDMPDWQHGDDIAFLNITNVINAPIISSGCLGLANAAFTHAKKYAQERQTFGIPLAKHQAISFLMAEMRTDIEAARIMTYTIIESMSVASNNFKLALSTLIFALDMTAHVSNDAVQIFGAYGYTKDYPVEKLMRDAKGYQLFYGGSRQQFLAENLI